MSFNIIVAIDQNRGIGKDGELPWHIPEDLKYFKKITTHTQDPAKQNAVVMGRKTWESIPSEYQPLSDRLNVVLTRTAGYQVPEDVMLIDDFDTALKNLESQKDELKIEQVFIIGGEQIFNKAIVHSGCTQLYITHIQNEYPCDAFFPEFSKDFSLASTDGVSCANGISCRFSVYIRNP